MTIGSIDDIQSKGMEILPDKLKKINLDDVDFLSGEWVTGVVADTEKDYVVPMFIAQNPNAGTYAFFQNGEGTSGIKIEEEDTIMRLRDGEPLKNIQTSFNILKPEGEETSAKKIREAKADLVEEVKKSSSEMYQLNPGALGTGVTKRAGIKAVYAFFKAEGVDITEELKEKKEIYHNLIQEVLKRESRLEGKDVEISPKLAENKKEEAEKPPEKIGKMDDFDYEDLIEERNTAANKLARVQRKKLSPDKDSPEQKTLADVFGDGGNVFTFGEAGVGKTKGIADLARKNKIESHQINFHADIRASDLMGKPDLRKAPGETTNSIIKKDGPFVACFRAASERAKQGGLTVLVGDDFTRGGNSTVSIFIANMTTHGRTPRSQEYHTPTTAGLELAKITTSLGEAWFVVGNKIDREKTKHKIIEGEDGKPTIHVDEKDAMMVYEGTAIKAAERFCRGDLLYMHEDDYLKVKTENIDIIQKTDYAEEKIYTPEQAMLGVITANTGPDYQIEIEKLDPAFLRRFLPTPIQSPPISDMVNVIHRNWIRDADWSPQEEEKVKSIMLDYFEAVQNMSENNDGVEVGMNPMYAVIQKFYTAMGDSNPMEGLKEMMSRQSRIFIPFDVNESEREFSSKNTGGYLEKSMASAVDGKVIKADVAKAALDALDVDVNIGRMPPSGSRRGR